jgi:hypothetical protein
LKHKFSLTPQQVQQGEWCRRCKHNLAKYQRELVPKHVRIVSKILRNIITLECPQGHSYTSHVRSIFKKTCTVCRREHNRRYKEKLQQEQQQRQEEDARRQQKLFEQARRKMQASQPHFTNAYQQGYQQWGAGQPAGQPQPCGCQQGAQQSLEQISQQVEQQAESSARAFLQAKENQQVCSMDQARAIYRLFFFPEEAFQRDL